MKQLYQQIERFFEAELTPKEEESLFKTLLKMEGLDPAVDEALAVMLASRVTPKVSKSRKIPPIRQIAGIAASIAIIFGTGVWLIRQPSDSQTFAYISGKKIQDTNEIKNIVANQLQDIGESSTLFSKTLSTDLDDIREALMTDDI